jgi:tetratricopeptide (TPR) repeat protein
MGGRADAPADILERGGLMTESETEFEAEGDSPGVPPGELEVVALDAIAGESPSAPCPSPADEPASEPIAAYCDREALDAPARIRVFQAACRAVHAAHQRGTVFGDLEPSRLRATAGGAGVLVVPPAREPSGPAPLGAYTSPEQVRGEPATTASDVYALGLALFELLAGRYPYRVDVGDPSALAKAISDQSPGRPSAAASRANGRPAEGGSGPEPPPKPRAVPAGDLDLIVLKAIHKEPERRYASAAELADDLDRCLQKLPVRAHAPSELYRLGRFLSRRRWAAPAALALIAAAVFAGVWSARTISTERRERERAERLYRSSRAAIEDVSARLAERPRGDEEDVAALRRGLLDGVSRYYEDFIATHERDPAAAADVAEAVTQMAMIARASGRKDAKARLRDAIGRWRSLVAARPGDRGPRERLAEALAEFGRTIDAGGGKGSRTDRALSAFEAARELLTPLVDAQPDARPLRRELARVYHDEAEIRDRDGQSGGEHDLVRRAIRLREELVFENPHDLDARLALASSYALMARIDARREIDRSGARGALERAIEVLDEAPGASASDAPPRLAFETARRLIDLADMERVDDAGREAVGHAGRAVSLLESLVARRPNGVSYQEELAASYNLAGELLRNQGSLGPALDAARKAEKTLDRLAAERPDSPSVAIGLSTTHQLLGRLLAQSGKNAEALASFRRAVDLLEGRADLDATNLYNLASALSLSLALVGAKDGAPPPEDDEKLAPADKLRRRLYAQRAVEVLRQAVDKGFQRIDVLRSDPALDPLRSREDFRKLLADLAAARP